MTRNQFRAKVITVMHKLEHDASGVALSPSEREQAGLVVVNLFRLAVALGEADRKVQP